MFTDEVNPLVHTKAHLASPALLKAVKVLRENLEGLQAAWDYDPDGVDEKTWLEQPIQNFITAVHSDMYELRRQLWPHAPFRWLRDAWFQWGLRARKKVK